MIFYTLVRKSHTTVHRNQRTEPCSQCPVDVQANESLALALKTASDRLKQRFFSNMSPRAVEMIRDDLDTLAGLAEAIEHVVAKVPGAADARTEQVTGLPLLTVIPNRERLAYYGLDVVSVHRYVPSN